MSGILNLSAPDLSVTEPLKALPRSLGERIGATADVIFSPDRYFNIADTRQTMWQRSVDELHATTGETFLNPYVSVTAKEAMAPDYSPGEVVKRRQDAIINAARLAKASGNEDLFDPENIDRYIAEDVRRREQRAASFEDTGNGIGNFIASIGMSAVEPINILALGVPVTRLPGAAASAIGRTFLGNVAREAALQAGANVVAQGATEALDYATKSEIGTQASPRDIAGNLVTAAGFGAVLGGGVRALHLKWLGLPEKVRADAPLEVRDAFKVIEADALYSGQNRLGIDPTIHERYQGRAYDAVMRGLPVRLEELTPADTPMTALGTILRSAPDQIRAEGLPAAVDRVRMLPDGELEPIVRELKPQAFAPLDAIDAKLKALDERVAAIHGEAQQIGLTDVIDLDTAALINDAIEGLKRPGLTRKQRLELEHQRDTWLQSVDPRGEMAGELERTRGEFFPEHGPALKEIAAEREKLMQERAHAQGEAQREVDFLRSKLDKFDFAKPETALKEMGVEAPADLPAMLQRAEFERQIRMAQQIMSPEGIGLRSTPASDISASTPAKEITPEAARALQTETARLLEKHADLEVEINGQNMSAAKAMEQADRLEREASIASNCAFGSL